MSHPIARSVPLVLLLVLGCETPAVEPLGPGAPNLGIAAGPPAHLSEWSTPVDLGPQINATNSEISPALSPDGLSLYFAANRSDGLGGGFDIWVARRASVCSPFGAPRNLGTRINSTEREQGAFISNDGHLLFFTVANARMTTGDLFVSRREDTSDDLGWGPPIPVGPEVNSVLLETEPWLSRAGGNRLYFGRGPGNQEQDFYVVHVDGNGRPTGSAAPVQELNSTGTVPFGNEDGIAIRGDGREVIFTSRRLPTGAAEMFVATRAGVGQAWGEPQLLAQLNSPRPDVQPALAHDGRTLVFSSARSGPGQFRLYMATRGLLCGSSAWGVGE